MHVCTDTRSSLSRSSVSHIPTPLLPLRGPAIFRQPLPLPPHRLLLPRSRPSGGLEILLEDRHDRQLDSLQSFEWVFQEEGRAFGCEVLGGGFCGEFGTREGGGREGCVEVTEGGEESVGGRFGEDTGSEAVGAEGELWQAGQLM